MSKNISRKANRSIVLFETALFTGLVSIFVESFLRGLDINLYFKVGLIMLFFGGLFSVFFGIIEPLFEKIITRTIAQRKGLARIIMHGTILVALFVLYALFYFGVKLV